MNGVVPLAVECITGDGDGREFGIGDGNALGMESGVEFAAHAQAGLGSGRADQSDDDPGADQRPGAPVHRDEGEEAMFDPVPFAGAGRQSLPR